MITSAAMYKPTTEKTISKNTLEEKFMLSLTEKQLAFNITQSLIPPTLGIETRVLAENAVTLIEPQISSPINTHHIFGIISALLRRNRGNEAITGRPSFVLSPRKKGSSIIIKQ